MCVAVKKKLQLYYWKDREFHELQVNLNPTEHVSLYSGIQVYFYFFQPLICSCVSGRLGRA